MDFIRNGISQDPNSRRIFRGNQNASKLLEKYLHLGKEALSSGDKILSENYFQHAEHFIRVLGERADLNNKNSISNDIKKNSDELPEEKKNQDQKDLNNLDNLSAD